MRDLTLLLVWILVAESFIQGNTHIISWNILRKQHDSTPFGKVLKQRELTLGLKNMSRTMFDLLLAIAVTWSYSFTGNPILPPIFLIVIVSAMAVLFYAVKFVIALSHESGIRPMEAVRLAQVAERLNIKRMNLNLDRRETNMDLRQDLLDQRQEEQTIQVEATVPVTSELVDAIEEVIVKTHEDTKEIKQDVKDVRRKLGGAKLS